MLQVVNRTRLSPDTGGLGGHAQAIGYVLMITVGIGTMEVKTGRIMVEYRCWGGDMRNVG